MLCLIAVWDEQVSQNEKNLNLRILNQNLLYLLIS
jgi:hypothetical protein